MKSTSPLHKIYSVAIALIITTSALSPIAFAQSQMSSFTVDDMLDVVNMNASDLSDDGRWLAATSGTLRDRIGIDNHRFGDPTYVAPNSSEVWVIDTESGSKQKIFPNKRQVRGLSWSPDASRLAMLVLNNDQFEPAIWERATGKTVAVKLPAGKQVADNSELFWSPDGTQLVLALRSENWRAKASERFKYETEGPVVVHSSKETFLAWDDLRRMSSLRSLAAYDVKTAQTRDILPENKINSYSLSEDGSFINYQQDITRKTDYDVIFGAENQIQILPFSGGAPKTLIKSTKGLSVVWSKDGRRYAYSKEGAVWFGSVDDKEPRQLLGKKPDSEKDKAEATSDKTRDDDKDKKDKEKERFNSFV